MNNEIVIKYVENENEICELYSIGEILYTHKEDIIGDEEPLIFGDFTSLATFALNQIKLIFKNRNQKFIFEKIN